MFCRTLILLFLGASTSLYFGCVQPEPVQQEVLLIRIPPFYDPNLTPGQNHFLWSEFLFLGETETRDKNGTIPDFGVPNDDSLITVKLTGDGKLFINSENCGDISNAEPAKRKLQEVFEERVEKGVFEPGRGKVVKAIGIRMPAIAKYGDLITVARAAKEAGAEPIILLLDGHLPEQLITFSGK